MACSATFSLPAFSLGLGEIEMQSFLNEPLRAEVELLDTRALTVDDIRIRLGGNDDFERLGIDRSFFLTGIKFDIEVDEASGRGVIRLRTEDAVLEPYLDLIIEARWPSGRLLREYTVLVDPPAFRQELITVSASERVNDENPDKPARAPEPAREPAPPVAQDGVALRESSLPPGEMPARAFSAETVDTPRAGNRYMVRRDETLWQIAAQGKPQGISVQQAMLDIQRLNPEAFINGNINQVKAGYIIYLPAAGEVDSDDLARALEEVREQNKQWRSGRAAPGVTAAATLRVSAEPVEVDRASGSESAAGASDSVSTTSRPEPRVGGDSAAPDMMGRDSEPAPAGADIASAQLAEQLDTMSERVNTLEQIVDVKDEQIATLEQALREARESAAATPPAVAAAQPASQPQSPATQAPASALAGLPWMPIAGGLLALILAILVFVLRRRGSSDDDTADASDSDDGDDVFAGVSLHKEKLAAEPEDDESTEASIEKAIAGRELEEQDAESAEDLTELLDPGGSRGYGERKNDDYIDEGSAGDALAEADIYIAYGRYLQAIELLEGAIENEPGNSAYRLKLIELYVDMGEEQRASDQLEELRSKGDTDAIARAEALLGGAGTSRPSMMDTSVAPDAADEGEIAFTGGAQSTAEAEESMQDLEGALDSEADLDALEFSSDTAADSDALSPEPADLSSELPAEQVETITKDFNEDLSEDFSEGLSEDLSEDLGKPSSESAGEGTGSTETPTFDLELDELDASVADTDASDDMTAEPLEFDLLEIEEPDTASDLDSELDFGDADDELDLSDAFVDTDASDNVDEENGEDILIAEDADQMATKLDLARAYIDMGDSEGARVILEEVAESGTTEQQQEAGDLLSRIG